MDKSKISNKKYNDQTIERIEYLYLPLIDIPDKCEGIEIKPLYICLEKNKDGSFAEKTRKIVVYEEGEFKFKNGRNAIPKNSSIRPYIIEFIWTNSEGDIKLVYRIDQLNFMLRSKCIEGNDGIEKLTEGDSVQFRQVTRS